MIRVIIIDDDKFSRNLLQKLLQSYAHEVEVLGIAEDVSSGILLIHQTNPDLVFLDVELKGGTGFDVLNAFKKPSFKTVFITNLDQYAFKAIKYSAIDYLLKPINSAELKKTLQRFDKNIKQPNESIPFTNTTNQDKTDPIERIILSDTKKHIMVPLEDIKFIQAEGSYVTFHLEGTKKYTTNKSLSYFEELLLETYFFRIHKSYLVNTKKVMKIESGRVGIAHLVEGTILPVAARRKSAFLKFLNRIG